MEQEIYPELTQHIKVRLSGNDGNAFGVIATCRKALMRSDVANKNEIWDVIHAEATAGNYNHLLQTMQKWFDVS